MTLDNVIFADFAVKRRLEVPCQGMLNGLFISIHNAKVIMNDRSVNGYLRSYLETQKEAL